MRAEIVRGAEIAVGTAVDAAGVLVAVDVVAGVVDALAAVAVDATAVTAAVAEDGTNFGHGSSRIPRINQEGPNERDRRKCGPFSLCRAK